VKRQPSLLDSGKRKAPLVSTLVAHNHDFLPGISFDTGDLYFVGSSARRITWNVRGNHSSSADEPSPILRVPEWSFDPRRRNFQHIIPAAKFVGIQPGFDRARSRRASVDRHLFPVLTLHANVENGATFTAPDLQIEKL
jgi:hypothetical protein